MCGILLVAEAIECTSNGTSDCAASQPQPSPLQAAAAAAAAAASSAQPSAALAALPPAPFRHGLQRRGPDHAGTCAVQIQSGSPTNTSCRLSLSASLLQLRGPRHVRPPLTAPTGSVLCFNGEVFGGLDVGGGANDGERLMDALEQAGAAGGVVVGSGRWSKQLQVWGGGSHGLGSS